MVLMRDKSHRRARTPISLNPKQIAAFWKKVGRRGPDDCWFWLGHKNDHGYGLFRVGSTYRKADGSEPEPVRNYLAHRVMLWLERGEMADELVSRHLCHEPSCCNPNHLEPGTYKQNKDDSVAEGRQMGGNSTRGGAHPRSLYSDAERAAAVRLHFTNRQTYGEIASTMGCSVQTVGRWCQDHMDALALAAGHQPPPRRHRPRTASTLGR